LGLILIKLKFSEYIFEKSPNITFYLNIIFGSRFVSCDETDGRTAGRIDRQTGRQVGTETYMTKLLLLFTNLRKRTELRNPGFCE